MLRRKLWIIIAVVVLSVTTAIVQGRQQGERGQRGQQAPPPPQMNVQMIKPGLWAILVPGSNTIAVRVTDEGVILVDDMVTPNYEGIVEKLKTFTDKPVKYIINTHHHADHTGGNAKFAASVHPEIIGHKNARAHFVGNSPSPVPGAMMVTIADEGAVYLGGAEVRMQYFGRGHTDGDIVVYFPDLKAVHMGDQFVVLDRPPVVDYAGGGSAIEMKKTLRKILNTLDIDVVIPGHGPISKKADVEQFIKNMDTLHTRMLESIRKGVPKDQTMVSQLKLDDLGWVNSTTGKPDPNALWARSITQYCDELIAANK